MSDLMEPWSPEALAPSSGSRPPIFRVSFCGVPPIVGISSLRIRESQLLLAVLEGSAVP